MVLVSTACARLGRAGVRCAGLAVLLLSAIVPSCTAEPPAEHSDVLEAMHRSCRELSTGWCASSVQCMGARFANDYGTAEECVARRSLLCEGTWFADGSHATPSDVSACAAATAAELSELSPGARCAKWLEHEVFRSAPKPCQLAGALPEGSDCISDTQCQGGQCRPALVCGRCGSLGSFDAPCVVNEECRPGLACALLRCGAFKSEKVACGPSAPCAPGLGCHFGLCEPRRSLNEDCDPEGDSCEFWPTELACSAKTKTCQPLDVRGEAEACGQLDDGTVAQCQHGFACRAYESPKRGSCVPLIEDGLSCAPSGAFVFGGPCREPARCIDGLCQLRSGAACQKAMP